MDKPHILVVEDEVFVAKNIDRRLRDLGYEVSAIVPSGAEAIQAATETDPDIVLMDIHLKGKMTGIEAAAQIREQCDIPVVFLTAYADDSTLQQAKVSTPYGYILKPFQNRELHSNIEIALYKHQQEHKLKKSEQRYRTISELISDFAFSFHVEPEGDLVAEWITDSFIRLTGFTVEDAASRGWINIAHPQDRRRVLENLRTVLSGQPVTLEMRVITRADEVRWLRVHGRPVGRANGGDKEHVTHIYGAARDITEQVRAEETKRKLMGALSERLKELNCLYGISKLVGAPDLSLEEIIQGIVNLLPPAWHYPDIACARIAVRGHDVVQTENFRETAWKQSSDVIVRGQQLGHVEVCYLEQRPDRDQGPFLKEEQNLLDAIARQVGLAVERKTAEEQLQYAALHDTLTGLPNRTLFMQHLERSIQRAQTQRGYLFAMLFLDLDRLKVVNDSLGHIVGDQLLVTIAQRLAKCVRPGDRIARFGGDEFAILLDGIRDIDQATKFADQVQEQVACPINLDGQEAFTTASIGIASNAIIEYHWPIDVLRDADTAMYRAKALGKARHVLFDTSMHARAVTRWQLETDLRQAVERGEFELYYQPFFSLITDKITGFEALLRWQHPRQGLIAPEAFIPLAEETGLIRPIGEWVLRTACSQVQAWRAAGHANLRVAVNVAARQFHDASLTKQITTVLQETGLTYEGLELEVTESVALREQDLITVKELSRIGISISLDDFGLGSSLDCLKHLPLDTLKIDQSFVSGVPGERDSEAIITAIISMAHRLRLKVIAEGVETQAQLTFLGSEWCDEIQGNLIGQPMPAKKATRLLHAEPAVLAERALRKRLFL